MVAGPVLSHAIQPEIIRAARNMIDNHGARASMVAKQRGDNLAGCGRYDVAATWQQIAAAIDQIQGGSTSATQ